MSTAARRGRAEAAAPRAGISTAPRKLWELSSSAGEIYGLIVVSGAIVVSRTLTGSSWEALLGAAGTLLVFFSAHCYAATLAEMGRERLPVRDALRRGLADSVGMLAVGAAPLLVLLLGVVGVLRPSSAVWLALLVDVVLLGVLGWAVAATRLRSPWARLGGALVTAAFGGALIALKAFIH
ncbi:hypothetical protein [Brachybacterium saurashtrense]|uniref:Uncharacterized protein n=1 Tax=Brachybacterium saurashtrense TaxID=556288 RepID=A0A345YKW8_9MICO|nr:hypothetical protein [Brachybacterium saurashtrense]AXK44570.1 hypothetical protein DWV08_02320 [Brachybacterium saurashtrense]RRR23182.1 hypothetical protein DXU92_07450 [Brachybacterium saurashtrense]